MVLGIFSHASWPFVYLLWRTDWGSGLALSHTRWVQGTHHKKDWKGGRGSLAIMTCWPCFHGSAPPEQRDAEPERDAEWRMQTRVGERNTALKSPKQVSGLLTLHRDRLLNLGRLSWTLPSGKLISHKNTEKYLKWNHIQNFPLRKKRNVGKDVEKLKPSYTASRDVKWGS